MPINILKNQNNLKQLNKLQIKQIATCCLESTIIVYAYGHEILYGTILSSRPTKTLWPVISYKQQNKKRWLTLVEHYF